MKYISIYIVFTILLYAKDADVVGRDGAAGFGHVGIMKDGYVFEMLGTSHSISPYFLNYSYQSNLHRNSLDSFKKTNTFWGQRYNSTTEVFYRSRITNYINPWVEFTYMIGAIYNLFDDSNIVKTYTGLCGGDGLSDGDGKSYCYKKIVDTSNRTSYRYMLSLAEYRCDSYVRTMYATGGFNIKDSMPKPIFNYFDKDR